MVSEKSTQMRQEGKRVFASRLCRDKLARASPWCSRSTMKRQGFHIARHNTSLLMSHPCSFNRGQKQSTECESFCFAAEAEALALRLSWKCTSTSLGERKAGRRAKLWPERCRRVETPLLTRTHQPCPCYRRRRLRRSLTSSRAESC